MKLRSFTLLLTAASALAAAIPVRAASGPAAQIAYTRANNVFLMNTAGIGQRTVTTRGTGYVNGGIVYPWYAWSPDGQYLLLVRMRADRSTGTLLILNRQGSVVRDLGTIPAPADFWPTWAIDADQIIYVSKDAFDAQYQGFRHTVTRVDLAGRSTPLFTYRNHEGCGGGTGDPAEALYWSQTGFGGDRPTLSWSASQQLAAFSASCAGGVNIVNLRTRGLRNFPRWGEPALSPSGNLAVVQHTVSPANSLQRSVLLVNARSGAVIRRVASGELPLWSHDGRTLYFVQRTFVQELNGRDALGNPRGLRIYRSAIYRTNAAGTGMARLYSADAHGFGALNLTPDGRSLIFSQVDNDWQIWQHRKGNVLAPDQGKYAPKVRIQRLDIGRGTVTLASNAGLPVVQPR